MAPHSHRRQVLLFLVAILLPCVALVALGLRLVVQERELATARLDEERRGVTRQLQQDLSSRLERIALRQATALASRPDLLGDWSYDDSLVALVAGVSEGELVLPWEHDGSPGESHSLSGQGVFGERVRRGEREEFASENPSRAITSYRQALEAAQGQLQETYARHLLARALAKAGSEDEAEEEYRRLASGPPGIEDEHGIPFSLYAARQLQETGRAGTAVADCLQSALDVGGWPTPAALYLLQNLLNGLINGPSDEGLLREARGLSQRVSGEIIRTEQALSLKEDYPSLGLIPIEANPDPVRNSWVTYGAPAWFVGTAPAGDRVESTVVAVRAEPILASLESGTTASGSWAGNVSLSTGATSSGEPLGTVFPGVLVSFLPGDGESDAAVGSIRRWFYSVGLMLVLGVTLFGAYLLWRDIRREVELAETRSRFVSAVSHELKTPLTAIRMFAETLHEGETVTEEAQSEYLETIVNESERLTRLLNNVLDFSKIERGQKTYRREPESLEEIIRVATRAMKYPLEQKRFALKLEIEEGMPPGRVDRDAIEQAILNLLANAMKYSGESRDITLRLRSHDGEAVIEVADGGVGIEPTEVPHIFERFYRVSNAENDRIPGTGLGLTLVQHIAEAHDGRIAVTSTPGKGSTLSLHLPLNGGEA